MKESSLKGYILCESTYILGKKNYRNTKSINGC